MGVLENFHDNLTQAGIDASLEIEQQNLLSQLNPFGAKPLGKIKVRNRLVDEIEVSGHYESHTQSGPAGSRKVSRLSGVDIDYVLSGAAAGKKNSIEARLSVKRTGLINKKVVQMQWEGGALAEKLNTDSEIHDLLWQSLGQLSARDMETKIDEAAGKVRIHVRDDRQVFHGQLPPFRLYEKIAEYIFSMLGITKTAAPLSQTPVVKQETASPTVPKADTPEFVPTAPAAKYCFKCGAGMPADAVFCPVCGMRQE